MCVHLGVLLHALRSTERVVFLLVDGGNNVLDISIGVCVIVGVIDISIGVCVIVTVLDI